MPTFKSIGPHGSVKGAIDYASKEYKNTHDSETVRGINLTPDPNLANIEMSLTKEYYGKKDGRQYQHYVLSFSDDDMKKLETKDVLDYAEKHAKECFGDRFQVYLALHQRSEGGHIHVHYIVNSVSFVDGRKIHTSKEDYDMLKNKNDRLAKRYGLKVIDRSPEAVAKRGRAQMYTQKEYQAFHKKGFVKSDCFVAIGKSLGKKPTSFQQFCDFMKQEGWHAILRGKNIVFINQKTEARFRANTLAKKFNNQKVTTANILKRCNYEGWQNYVVVESVGKEMVQQTETTLRTPLKSHKHILKIELDDEEQPRKQKNNMKINFHDDSLNRGGIHI